MNIISILTIHNSRCSSVNLLFKYRDRKGNNDISMHVHRGPWKLSDKQIEYSHTSTRTSL